MRRISSKVNASSQAKADGPQSDWFLSILRLLNLATGVCCILCALALGLSVMVGPKVRAAAALTVGTPLVDQALRMYGILIAIIGLIAETEWRPLFANAPILEQMLFRGFYHTLLALLTMKMATFDNEAESDIAKSIHLYRRVSSLSLLSCALLYCMGGVLCLNILKRRRSEQLLQRARLEASLLELEMKKAELTKLLQSE